MIRMNTYISIMDENRMIQDAVGDFFPNPKFQWSRQRHLHGNSGLILGLRPANERRRYEVTPSLIGWAQT